MILLNKKLTVLILLGFVLVYVILTTTAVANEDILTARTTADFDSTLEKAKLVLEENTFTVAHVQRCDGGLRQMGYETDNYKIIFFGRLEEVRSLTKAHPELLPFLPLKMAVFAENKETLLSTVNPSSVLAMMPELKEKLQPLFSKWEKELRQVLSEFK